jgi:hypothetical protein
MIIVYDHRLSSSSIIIIHDYNWGHEGLGHSQCLKICLDVDELISRSGLPVNCTVAKFKTKGHEFKDMFSRSPPPAKFSEFEHPKTCKAFCMQDYTTPVFALGVVLLATIHYAVSKVGGWNKLPEIDAMLLVEITTKHGENRWHMIILPKGFGKPLMIDVVVMKALRGMDHVDYQDIELTYCRDEYVAGCILSAQSTSKFDMSGLRGRWCKLNNVYV